MDVQSGALLVFTNAGLLKLSSIQSIHPEWNLLRVQTAGTDWECECLQSTYD